MRERYCKCGEVYDAIDEDDRMCKRCLLTVYRKLLVRVSQLEDR